VKAARRGDAEAFTDDEATRRFLRLTEKITRHAYRVTDEDIDSLREAGWDDEEIVEAVHVVASFNALDRIADTLGISGQDAKDDLRREGEAHGLGRKGDRAI
jgi:alkylhydroperoxidase family enzyme